MSKKNPVTRHPVIAGLIVLAIGAVVKWLFPLVPSIFNVVVGWLAVVFGVLGTPLGLPMWLLGAGLAVIGISTKRRFNRWIARSEVLDDDPIAIANRVEQLLPKIPPPEPELDDVQEAIMRAFKREDTQALNPVGIGYHIKGTSKLRIKKAIDDLEVIGFLHSYRASTSYGLTSAGRNYILVVLDQ